MTYIKLSQLHKTLAFAFAVVGSYSTMPVANGNPSSSVQSTLPAVVSTATRTSLPVSRLSMPGRAIAESLLNNNILVTQPKRLSAQPVSQNQPSEEGAPRSLIDGATRAQQPSDQGAPGSGSRPGAGSRGGHSCPQGNKTLTPLMPVTAKNFSRGQDPTSETTPSDSNLGLTVAEHPTLWLYIPFPLTPQRPIEFVLEDDQANEIYKTTFTEAGISPGIVGFKLPTTAPRLEINKTYHWYFSVYCTPDRTDDPIFAEGAVKRIPLNSSLTRQLEQAKPQQRFELYAKASLWHEAVTSLAELRRKNPDDVTLKNEWTTLLQAMNLEAIAKEPITTMLTPQQ